MLNELKITFAFDLYPLEAVYATCWQFIENYYIYLDKKKNKLEIIIKPKAANQNLKKKDIEGVFRNELLGNALRIKIAASNAPIREYIINQAIFSSLPASSQEEIGHGSSFKDDPLGIAIPWEEKYKSKKSKK